nr:hypothetical protein [Kofleriaceae bacterium]
MNKELDAVAGEVAVDIAKQVADPVRALRDRLGLVVDHLERHVATSTGPTPYPWRGLQALRQDLAAAYLEATHLARRLDELDRALRDEPLGLIDVGAAVDLGLRLANHHVGTAVELICDLGEAPPARGNGGSLALVVAQMIGACARSARAVAGSSLSVRVAADADAAVIAIADNGGGDDAVPAVGDLARAIVGPWGATVDAASAPGRGCAFELRFPP